MHQFTDSMIQRKQRLRRRPGIALTVNVDGFGNQASKLSKYRSFTGRRSHWHNGIKLFYEEDTDLMSPRQVLRLRPRPDVIVYE